MNEVPLDETSILEESDPLLDLAKKHFGASFLFPYQRLVICSTLEACGFYGPERAEETNPHRIIILPTGAGKSLCFSLPALIMEKPTLILYPLLGLMGDQERRFREAGMSCAVLRGGQGQAEREKIWRALEMGELKVLLSNPETLLTEAVMSRLKGIKPGHLVIDETHTVSEWGDTFRPAYLRLREIIQETGVPMVSAYTATASPRILERLKEIIFSGLEPALVSANPDRPNITYRVIPVLSKTRALAGLLGKGPAALERPALVFCRSRAGAELTARELRKALGSRGVFFYHAGLSREEKQSIEAWFFSSRSGILAATCAYGMGVDKPDKIGRAHV